MSATTLGADALLAPLRTALLRIPADEAELSVRRRRSAIARYSRSQVHQNADADELRVQARAVVGGAVGVATANSLDEGDLRALVATAAGLARDAAADPEWPGLARPGDIGAYAEPRAFDAETALADASAQAAAIATIAAAAEARGYRAAGTHAIDVYEHAVANSHGVAAYAPQTTAYLRALVQSETGSGYAEDLASNIAALDAGDIAQRAIEKCALDHDRRELAPGDYEAVFEELAVAEILRIVSITGLGGQSVREGRSFMTGRIGEQVTGARFTLHDDALDGRTLAVPFDVEGTPKRRVTLVENGIARGPVYDRHSAAQAGTASTGHAADPARYARGGHAANLTMAGGDASRDELIGAVSRGILITRFHYTNSPDPKAATMTGTTRDGTFLIEDGRITAALPNLRYTMSALDLFAGIDLLGRQRLARDWWSSNGMGHIACLVPPIKVARATIAGSSPL